MTSKEDIVTRAGARAAGKPKGALDKDKPDLANKGPAPAGKPPNKGGKTGRQQD